MAADACPVAWPALSPGPSADGRYDGRVAVLVGGNLAVAGSASGAEGIVVVRGNATFARDVPGSYEVGVTALGSQVAPHPDSDMLVVGGDLTSSPGTSVDVGRNAGGDVVVGGAVADPAAVQPGGTVDVAVPGALAPYDALLGDLADKSAAYAARNVTGTVDVTDTAITLTGDGTSDPQVFTVDGSTLGASVEGTGRSLQVLGVPDGAGVVVNVTGSEVAVDVDSLLAPGGATVDPAADAYFADLSTHLLWNAVSATAVRLGGQAQLPGSLLVPTSPSTTTLAGPGTNGRVLVAGDLVHTGEGGLHSYPFLRDPDLGCGPELAHLGTLTVDVELDDPAGVVDPDRFFEGSFTCSLDGDDVTPADATWQVRPKASTRSLSEQIPVGATCFLRERLEVAPAPGWQWAAPQIAPDRVKVAKRDPRGFTVINRVQQVKTPPVVDPTSPPEPTPTTPPTSTPTTPSTPVAPGPTELPEPDPTAPVAEPSPDGPSVLPDGAVPSMLPVTPPEPSAGAEPSGDDVDTAEPPRRPHGPGPLTTTAPYTLRGAVVWGPMLLLSVLALRLQPRWKRRQRRRH